jgi:hypothetical protein
LLKERILETLAYETDHKYNMLEGLPLVFHTDPVKRNVYANWHENIEILACIEGEGTLFCDSESHDFTVGDILVINSNQVHRVGSENGVTYHCFIIDNDFCNKYGIDMTKLRFRTKITDEELYKTFIHIAKLICGINADGSITGISTLSHKETSGIGSKVVEDNSGYRENFYGKTADNYSEVDAVTGATISSKAYKKALDGAFEAYELAKEAK